MARFQAQANYVVARQKPICHAISALVRRAADERQDGRRTWAACASGATRERARRNMTSLQSGVFAGTARSFRRGGRQRIKRRASLGAAGARKSRDAVQGRIGFGGVTSFARASPT